MRYRHPLESGKDESRGREIAAQAADHLLDRADRAPRVSPVRAGGDFGVEQGVREDRLHRRHPGRAISRATTNSIRRTSATTPSAGSPLPTVLRWGLRGRTPRRARSSTPTIVFDEGMIRYLREEYLDMAGIPAGSGGHDVGPAAAVPQALRRGLAGVRAIGADAGPLLRRQARGAASSSGGRFQAPQQAAHCHLGPMRLRGMRNGAGHAAAVGLGGGDPGRPRRIGAGGKVPEKLLAQAVKEIVMHEVGHTLGLRHNFKASSIYTAEADQRPRVHRQARQQRLGDGLPAGQHRPARERSKAITSRPPSALTTTGPSNTPISRSTDKSKEKEELAKIAAKVSDPELAFGTDEDAWLNPDPRIHAIRPGRSAGICQESPPVGPRRHRRPAKPRGRQGRGLAARPPGLRAC